MVLNRISFSPTPKLRLENSGVQISDLRSYSQFAVVADILTSHFPWRIIISTRKNVQKKYSKPCDPPSGLKRCGQGRHSSTTGQQRWRSTTSQLNIGRGKPKPMSMVSVGCRSILHPQKMCSSTFASLKTRMKSGNSRKSSTPQPTSVGKCCGNSSATTTTTEPVTAFASKSPRAVPSVSWVVIMATVRRRREPSSPKGHGTHYPSTLWDLSPPTTARSSSSCLWTATRGIPSSSRLATTSQTR